MKIFFSQIILVSVCILFSQVSFEMDFYLEKNSIDDQLLNLQLFDYDNDGNDEILGSFTNQDHYKIICYSQDGDTLFTHDQLYINEESLGNSFAFTSINNEKLIILAFIDEYGFDFEIKLMNLSTFVVTDSLSYSVGYPFFIDEIFQLIMCSSTDGNYIYAGINLFLDSGEENLSSVIYKFELFTEQIEYIEEIENYGTLFIKHPENDFIISTGYDSTAGVGAWVYVNVSYYFGLISTDYICNIQPVFSTSGSVVWSEPPEFTHYPSNFTIVSRNDNNYQNFGPIIYYKSTDSNNGTINHFKCYDNSFSNLLWERNDSNIGNGYISTSTCVSVNNEDDYVMYFRGDQLEIRNRNNGNIVHYQTSSIQPFRIFRKSDNELIFLVEQEDGSGYEVYIISSEIQVSVNDNHIPASEYTIYNHPNPFNPTTTIEFSIKYDSRVELVIYNIKGQKIKTLAQNEFTKGNHSIIWNGNDEFGKSVSSGVYYYKLTINGKSEAVKKCLLLK